MEFLKRQKVLLGQDLCDYINNKKVMVVGLGGVGGAALESIVRAGVGNILIWDNDTVDITNLNRQIIATRDVVGQKKVLVCEKRILSINENCNITIVDNIYKNENRDIIIDYKPDYVIDAIDTITHKIDLIECCFDNNIPVISSMGTGNKIDNLQFCYGKIKDTKGQKCPMARIMRKELKARNIENLDVIYSKADVYSKSIINGNGRNSPGSISFCPPVSGYMMGGFVINKFIDEFNK